MKKHDEGYVLAYVTVVLLIFCLVAALILTGAMRNLNHQQDSIQQMKDQYVAEGMIEQVVAERGKYTFVQDMEFGDSRIQCTNVNNNLVTLTATSNSVMITCVFDKTTGEYESYQISAVEPIPSEIGGVGE